MDSRSIEWVILETTDVSREQLDRAFEVARETGEPITEVLIEMGLMSEKQMARCQADVWGIAFVDLADWEPDPELLRVVAPRVMRQYRCVPLRIEAGNLVLAMADVTNIFTIDELQIGTGLRIVPAMAAKSDVEQALQKAEQSSEGEDATGRIEAMLSDLLVEPGAAADVEPETAELDLSLAEEPPVVKLVDLIIRQGLRDGASDIHVQPESDRVRVRYRIDGVLVDGQTVPKPLQSALLARVKILASIDIAEKRVPQDGLIGLRIDGEPYELRVATLPGAAGESVVLRVMDRASSRLALDELGLEPEVLEQFREVAQQQSGLLLAVGPTGSGKTTTTYAVLEARNTGQEKIITVEDPVVFDVDGITQTSVNAAVGSTLQTLTRAALRQDPDVLMVVEIRDRETASLLIDVALTGHFAVSSVHAGDAVGAVARLLEMGVDPFLVADAIKGALAQRLIRTVCSDCAQPYMPPAKSLERLNLPEDVLADARFVRGAGCSKCRSTGYKGRVGCFELLVVTDELRLAILEEQPISALRDLASRHGMRALAEDALLKAARGITTLEEALRVPPSV